jgi:O-antigen ligase
VSSLIPDLRHLVAPLVPQGALGSLFWTWLIALAFAQAAVNTRLHPGWRLALAGLVAGAIWVALFREREWASGWLPGCIAILAVVALRRPILTALLAVSVSVIAVLNLESLVHFFWTTEQQYSFMTRMEAARVLSQVISVNPLLGLGPANYYYYTPLYPILGWYVSFSSHNNYIDVLAQTGILGLVSFLWFLVELARTALRLRRKVPEGFQLAYVYGTIGGLAGTLCAAALADWFLPFVYNVGLKGFAASILGWVFLGGLVALEQHYFQIGKRKQPITQSG